MSTQKNINRSRFQFTILDLIEASTLTAICFSFWACWGRLSIFAMLPVLGLALGFAIGRRWGTTFDKKKAIGIIVFWITLIVGAPVLGMIIMAIVFRGSGTPIEYQDVSYEYYMSVGRHRDFDPQGASHIFYYHAQAIDSFDSYQKMSIPPGDYQSLISAMNRNFDDPRYGSYEKMNLGPARKFTKSGPSIPNNWPSYAVPAPKWWDPSKANSQADCTYWELQTKNRGTNRSRGWYWLYDPKSSYLWIWEWNYQHQTLGW